MIDNNHPIIPRPEPPILKGEVKQIIDCLIEGDCLNDEDALTLRRALESLPISMTDIERDAARYRWIKAAPRLRIERMPDSHFWISAETGEKYSVTHELAAFNTGFHGLPTLDDLVDQAMELYPITTQPPSLKEQAIFAAAVLQSPDETCSIAEIAQHWHTVRRALESLPD